MSRVCWCGGALVVSLIFTQASLAQASQRLELKRQAAAGVEAMKKRSQVMNDMVFSFAELGFQEFETSKYLTGILEKEGFAVERDCGHTDGLDGDVGIGQAGDRPRLRH